MGVAADFVTENDCGIERCTSPRLQLVALPPKIAACAVVALALNMTGLQHSEPSDPWLMTFPVPFAGNAVLDASVMIWLVPPVRSATPLALGQTRTTVAPVTSHASGRAAG